MIGDLFRDITCKTCGSQEGFERLMSLDVEGGTDFLCRCQSCGALFVTVYQREAGHER